MENSIVNSYSKRAMSNATRRALFASGVWIRVGFTGAFALAAGIAQIVGGELSSVTPALIAGGGALGVVGWRRAQSVLDAADAGPVTTGVSASTDAGAATPAVQRSPGRGNVGATSHATSSYRSARPEAS